MAKARPSSAEIDRFLEEVNRRKQQQARQSAPPPQVQREPPKPRMQVPPPPKNVKVQQKQVLVEEPVIRPIVLESMPEPLHEQVGKSKTSAYQLPTAPPPVPRGTISAPIQHAKALLKSSDGLRAMFIMNEILSPPRSKRRFR